MTQNSNRNRVNIKKSNFIQIFGISLLIIALLFYFGSEQFDNSGESNNLSIISDLYAQTLEPLLGNNQLTNEDVLNFALYNNLPVDKNENKILEIKDDEFGNEVIEVRTAEIKSETENYNKFVQKMKLKEEQKDELDTILEKYKDNIVNTIFSDNKSTLAVDSRIGLLHQILRTEIFDFIARVKAEKNTLFAHSPSSLDKFNKVIEKEKNKAVRKYIFFTPDTVLQSEAEFRQIDKNDPTTNLPVIDIPQIKAIRPNPKIAKSSILPEKEFKYSFDSNSVKVVLSNEFFKSLGIDEFKELKSSLDSSSNKFAISVGIPSEEDINFHVTGGHPDSVGSFHFEFNLNELGSLITNSINIPQNPQIEDWTEFGHKMDSLSIRLQEIYSDTLKYMD